jgi:hypothetical protein
MSIYHDMTTSIANLIRGPHWIESDKFEGNLYSGKSGEDFMVTSQNGFNGIEMSFNIGYAVSQMSPEYLEELETQAVLAMGKGDSHFSPSGKIGWMSKSCGINQGDFLEIDAERAIAFLSAMKTAECDTTPKMDDGP